MLRESTEGLEGEEITQANIPSPVHNYGISQMLSLLL